MVVTSLLSAAVFPSPARVGFIVFPARVPTEHALARLEKPRGRVSFARNKNTAWRRGGRGVSSHELETGGGARRSKSCVGRKPQGRINREEVLAHPTAVEKVLVVLKHAAVNLPACMQAARTAPRKAPTQLRREKKITLNDVVHTIQVRVSLYLILPHPRSLGHYTTAAEAVCVGRMDFLYTNAAAFVGLGITRGHE